MDNKIEKIDTIMETLKEMLRECRLCCHKCGVDRTAGEVGQCCNDTDPDHLCVSSQNLHYGEESAIVGNGGSGTVFFTHCNLHCVFCQNYDISQIAVGNAVHYTELSRIFLTLQGIGAENINVVTPTHYAYPIMLALRHAYRRGLSIPLVYNTGGYDSLELIQLLEGIVDIYMPDMKYMSPEKALKYSGAENYPKAAKAILKEMYRQVGPLKTEDGVAYKGLLIRHLILPNKIAGTRELLEWLKEEDMTDVTINLMRQYHPQYHASKFPELNRYLSTPEYDEIVDYARELGFHNALTQ